MEALKNVSRETLNPPLLRIPNLCRDKSRPQHAGHPLCEGRLLRMGLPPRGKFSLK
jgi:hypothetical protein